MLQRFATRFAKFGMRLAKFAVRFGTAMAIVFAMGAFASAQDAQYAKAGADALK